MTIGELANRSGLPASALRYYERIGLIPAPLRRSGRRDYAPDALYRLEVVQCARACGFTLSEIRHLVRGFETPDSPRWRTLAESKIKEMKQRIEHAEEMMSVLQRIKRCVCGTIEECGQRLSDSTRPRNRRK